ncbi:hypothetical protein [Streptomyces sp. XY413]|uniref:hypothetical protein n=1 Tax=Streptomyces sp. XY413 TaxID=1519479 RepID=UPI000B1B01C4|nr:hypothetical protein [Streptomyces sp. XY413]
MSREDPAYWKANASVARQLRWRWVVGSGALVSLMVRVIALRRKNVEKESTSSGGEVPPEIPPPPQAGVQPPEDQPPSKLDLLEASFDEVLDAIKHMDDKIGRLLTSVAFLTAATLALASLATAKYFGHDFDITPFDPPMALISITVFLLGVFIAVMLLLAGLTAPIGVPGLTGDPAQDPRPNTGDAAQRSTGIGGTESGSNSAAGASAGERRISQLWFLRIAEATRGEWEDEWKSDDRAKRREWDLIRETQNLARRATFKHDRIREAVAILSISLLAFAVSVVFTAAAASFCPADGSSCKSSVSVTLDALHRYTLSVLFAAYILVQIGIPARHAMQSIAPAVRVEDRRQWDKHHWKSCYAVSAAVLVGAILAHPGLPDVIWILLVAVSAVSSILAFNFSIKGEEREAWKTVGIIVATCAATVPALFWGIDGNYAWQLVSAVGVSGAFLIISLLRPTFDLRQRQKRGAAASGDAG